MISRLLLSAMIVLLFGACATYHDTSRQRLATLPQRYSQFDLHIAWETKVVGDETLIEGVVKNVRWAYMHDLEIAVSALDSYGKVMAKTMTHVIPFQLRMDETTEFGMKLPIAVAPGTKLRFSYRYRGDDGGDGRLFGGLDSGTYWMQSFDALAPETVKGER